jgi:NAD(P)H-hydrate epimerase
VIRLVNAAGRPVLAVDLPSGLDADTGEVLGEAVRATVTVTFVARKPGFSRGRGPELCGRIVVAEIGIPRPLLGARV